MNPNSTNSALGRPPPEISRQPQTIDDAPITADRQSSTSVARHLAAMVN
jgi:hypothetical protein